MKLFFLSCFLLFASCGSPLDEGYWKEHNQAAKPPQDNEGEEVEFNIDLKSLHTNVNLDFSGQIFKKLANGKIDISSEVAFPSEVTLVRYRIEVLACSNYTSSTYNFPNADQNTNFNRNGAELSQIADKPNQALQGQFLYVYGTIGAGGGGGTVQVRLACSEITR